MTVATAHPRDLSERLCYRREPSKRPCSGTAASLKSMEELEALADKGPADSVKPDSWAKANVAIKEHQAEAKAKAKAAAKAKALPNS